MDVLITDLKLGDRAEEHLGAAGIDTLSELREYSRQQLIDLKGIGAVTADEILEAIAAYDEGVPVVEEVAEEAIADEPAAEPTLEERGAAIEQAIKDQMEVPEDEEEAIAEAEVLQTFGTSETIQIQQLAEILNYAIAVFKGQGPGQQGLRIAGILRQAMGEILRMKPEEIDDIPGKLPEGVAQ